MTQTKPLQAKLDRFEAFLRADPDNTDLLVQLGDLHHQAGNLEQALACFERVRVLAPQSPVAASRMANVHLSQHRFEQAAAIFSELIDAGERTPALLHNLGIALYYQNRIPDAVNCFSLAAAEGLVHPANWKYLANCLHQLNQLDDAIAAAEKWVATDDGPESKACLALLEFDNGNLVRAAQLAREVLAAQPENADANAVIGSLALEIQDIGEAGTCFAAALKQRPDHGRAWLGLGLSKLHNKENAAAIEDLTMAAEQMPMHAGTKVALGWAKLVAHDIEGAEAVFRQAIANDHNFAESHSGLAVALARQNRMEEAQQAIKTANRLDPANFGAVYATALLQQSRNQPERARNLIERALERPAVEGSKPLIEYLQQYLQNQTRR